jgi:nitrate reductase gamma subunit
MPEGTAESLRKALDEMDTLRKRSLWITRLMLIFSIVFLLAAYGFMLFSPMPWFGMFCAVSSLYALIGGAAVNVAGASNANTQRILKAIDSLSRDR